MLKKAFFLILSMLFLIPLTGCNSLKAWIAQEFMQDKISDGVARLSAQHMSMIMYKLNDKFEGEDAKVTIIPSSDPKEIGKGTVIWTVNDVDIEHKNEMAVYTDCQGQQGMWQGKARIVKARKTMYGRLTNNAKRPVIPDVGKLKIEVEAKADQLSIRFPSKEGYLKINEGDIAFAALPRLAQNSTGMRLTPTSNTKFENVYFKNVRGELNTKDVTMPVHVNDSDFYLQVGEGEDGRENVIDGSITLFGNKRSVPLDGKGLDPNFDAKKFRETYACHEELQGVISYSHIAIENKLAHGMAALSASLMAQVASLLEENVECGMSSPQVIARTTISGDPGEEGEALSLVNRPCVMMLEKHLMPPNCFGIAKEISGQVIVMEAKKALKGVVVATPRSYQKNAQRYEKILKSGDHALAMLARPKALLPNSSTPVNLRFTAKLSDIEMKDVCLRQGNLAHPLHCTNEKAKPLSAMPIFRVQKGNLSGEMKPLLAKVLNEDHATFNFCAQKTSAGELSIEVINLDASIERDGFNMRANAKGHYNLVVGAAFNRENELKGSLKVNDMLVKFESKDKKTMPLDPDYDRANFLDSFMSCEKMALVKNERECRAENGLSSNVARLLVQNAGTLLKISSSPDINMSFASNAFSSSVLSADENTVTLSADIKKLSDFGPLTTSHSFKTATSIAGRVESLSGTMVRSGQRINEPYKIGGFNLNFKGFRVVEGLTSKITGVNEFLIRPTAPDATNIFLSAQLSNFTSRVQNLNDLLPGPRIKFMKAHYEIDATPYCGIDKRSKGEQAHSYSIATPIVRFDRVEVKAAPLTMKAGGMVIPLYVHEANIRAMNGRFEGDGNYIEGTINFDIRPDLNNNVMNDDHIVIINRQKLVMDFDQDRFDESYALTDNLEQVLEAE